jgi:hypothetical protein
MVLCAYNLKHGASMNPKEFAWNESQQITVVNPTANIVTFQVHGKQYELGAGQSAKMPGYLAWIYVYNAAAKLCQADKQFERWNEEEIRKEYYDKFVVGVEPLVQEIKIEKSLVETLDDDSVSSTETTTTPPNDEGQRRRGRPARV